MFIRENLEIIDEQKKNMQNNIPGLPCQDFFELMSYFWTGRLFLPLSLFTIIKQSKMIVLIDMPLFSLSAKFT